MMNKKGFMFIETIIVIVVLTSSLLLLYSSFTKILQSEKTRIYYDDVNYVYRTQYIAKVLSKLNITSATNSFFNSSSNFVLTIGADYDPLFTGKEAEKTFFVNMLKEFEVTRMIVLQDKNDTTYNIVRNCTLECATSTTGCSTSSGISKATLHNRCNSLYLNASEGLINYLKTVNTDNTNAFIIVIEYKSCNSDNTNCRNYYSWVGM